MRTRNFALISFLWPLGFLGFLFPPCFFLFSFGLVGSHIASEVARKEGAFVKSVGGMLGVMITDTIPREQDDYENLQMS